MNDRPAVWCLFFPERMSALDFGNLEVSGCHRIQQFLGTAQSAEGQEQLRRLGGMGVSVTFRIEEGTYYYGLATPSIMRRIADASHLVHVEGVIVGNEPEHPYDLTWNSANWGNLPDHDFPNEGGKAVAHEQAVRDIAERLGGLPIKICSPGWTHRRITPYEPPQPGRYSWRELTLPAYNRCDANGVHLYAHAWASAEDENRLLWAAGDEVARCHKEVWVNEINVNRGTQVERMAAVLDMYQLLAGRAWSSRITSFCPFVSNGTGAGYDPGYIMQQPECYAMLGNFIRGG